MRLKLREELHRPGPVGHRRGEDLVDRRGLLGHQADLAGHAELRGDPGRVGQLHPERTDGRAVDRAGQAGGLGGDGELRAGVGQGHRVVVEAGVAAVVAEPQAEAEGVPGVGDGRQVLHAAGRLDQRDDLGVEVLCGAVDVLGRLHHRQHDALQARRLGQRAQVLLPPLGAEAVDPHPALVAVGRQPLDDVRPGLVLALRGDGVLDVEEDDISSAGDGRVEAVGVRGVHEQPGAGELGSDSGGGHDRHLHDPSRRWVEGSAPTPRMRAASHPVERPPRDRQGLFLQRRRPGRRTAGGPVAYG
ncbi:hypothetical protein SDC9_98325 [bioreactor metagenome]|uniref:Uncharacterized protein n=1 Tax=bioreactor metagenome TaxID=1076179 RepID=A0A645AF43_9ZZZZ